MDAMDATDAMDAIDSIDAIDATDSMDAIDAKHDSQMIPRTCRVVDELPDDRCPWKRPRRNAALLALSRQT